MLFIMNFLMYISLLMVVLYFILAMVDSYYLHRPKKAFLRTINEKRPVVTKIFRLYFRLVIAAMILTAVISGFINWKNSGEYSFPFTTAALTIIYCICYYCIRFLHSGTVRGENCEYCCGNCAKCDIKCTTNWKYYGIGKNK